jgi:hypothetical protein
MCDAHQGSIEFRDASWYNPLYWVLLIGSFHDREKPRPLGRGLALGVQGGGSAPARGWGESPILGIELSAEGARAKLWRTSDGRVY